MSDTIERRKTKTGIAKLMDYFGDCADQPERWDARRLSLALFLNKLRQAAGEEEEPVSDALVGRDVNRARVEHMAEHAAVWALELVEGLFGPFRRITHNDEPTRVPETCWATIYFIQGEAGGPIKIGIARNVKVRVGMFQPGCPVPLRILATQPGDHELERSLHRRFAADRLHGEWFKASEALLDYIAGLQG